MYQINFFKNNFIHFLLVECCAEKQRKYEES